MEAIRRKIRKSLYKAGRRGLVLMALLFFVHDFLSWAGAEPHGG